MPLDPSEMSEWLRASENKNKKVNAEMFHKTLSVASTLKSASCNKLQSSTLF